MSSIDYFYFFFLGTIAVTRLLLTSNKMAGPTVIGIRFRHYMLGLILLVPAFLFSNITIYAIALGLIIDEVPVILAKGPGHKDEYWRGCEDYHTRWSVAGVLVLALIFFVCRDFIVKLL